MWHLFQVGISDGGDLANNVEKVDTSDVKTESNCSAEKKMLTVEELAKLRMELKARQKLSMVSYIYFIQILI